MPAATVFIPSHARSAVVPVGGAFKHLQTHEIAAPVLQALLQRAGLPANAVDAVVLGNALGAGGNPARMLALAGQLPLHCAAYTVDTQCCAGLDAVALGASLVASGQAEVVVAGGAEAWSRAPIRATRPLHAGDSAAPYERPPFAPRPMTTRTCWWPPPAMPPALATAAPRKTAMRPPAMHAHWQAPMCWPARSFPSQVCCKTPFRAP